MENPEQYALDLKAELEAAKAELAAAQQAKAEAEKQAAKAEAALKKSGVAGPIKGEYKGFTFANGHRRVRAQNGKLCDTEMLLSAAAEGDATATGILDWLIKIDYKYFTKGTPVAPAEKAAKKKK